MHDERMLHSKFSERCRHKINHIRRENTENLRLRARGIRQWSQEIEYRSNANLFPRRSRMACRRMRRLRKQEANSDFPNRVSVSFEWQIDPHPQRFQHVR